MLETVTLQSGDKMDYSTPFRMAEDGSLSHNNQTVHGKHNDPETHRVRSQVEQQASSVVSAYVPPISTSHSQAQQLLISLTQARIPRLSRTKVLDLHTKSSRTHLRRLASWSALFSTEPQL
jgi:hypothetical protein